MTGQELFDRYVDAGSFAAVELVNERALSVSVLRRVLAVDPPSVAALLPADVPGFVALAQRLREVFGDLDRRDVDGVAHRLNQLLAQHPAHPHLAKEGGRWRLHHHAVDAGVVAMWTSICAESIARLVGAGGATRLGTCAAPGCGRVYLDGSKNASRRFCSTTCNNRVRSASYRQRRAPT